MHRFWQGKFFVLGVKKRKYEKYQGPKLNFRKRLYQLLLILNRRISETEEGKDWTNFEESFMEEDAEEDENDDVSHGLEREV